MCEFSHVPFRTFFCTTSKEIMTMNSTYAHKFGGPLAAERQTPTLQQAVIKLSEAHSTDEAITSGRARSNVQHMSLQIQLLGTPKQVAGYPKNKLAGCPNKLCWVSKTKLPGVQNIFFRVSQLKNCWVSNCVPSVNASGEGAASSILYPGSLRGSAAAARPVREGAPADQVLLILIDRAPLLAQEVVHLLRTQNTHTRFVKKAVLDFRNMFRGSTLFWSRTPLKSRNMSAPKLCLS